jgi:hypothetical protein
MSCLCSDSAASFVADFDVPNFSLSLPSGMLSVAAAANAAAGASASFIAQLQASVSLSASLKMSAMASAMTTLQATGVFPGGPSPTLGALVASLNLNLPALSALLEFNTPSMTNLGILASLVAGLGQLGINPMSAGAAAQLQSSLNASAAASVSATASASASASAALSASAQASAVAQAALGLGLPMSGPAPFGSLSALISALTSSSMPPLTFSASMAGQLMAIFSALVQAKLALGIDMCVSGSATLLAQFAAQMDLNALASVNVSAAAVSASGQAAAASASGTLAAQLDAMLNGLSLGMLADLSLVAALTASLGSMGLNLNASPCAACRFLSAAPVAA